jgi:hypothetical protein
MRESMETLRWIHDNIILNPAVPMVLGALSVALVTIGSVMSRVGGSRKKRSAPE